MFSRYRYGYYDHFQYYVACAGLAITNAVRDTVAGDYLSGVARATEAILVAIAIAVGVGFVLSISLRLGGM